MDEEGRYFPARDRRPAALGNMSVLPDELICSILTNLTPRDVARLSCVSSVMYIFCNEEPLWMGICLNKPNPSLRFHGSWKKTALSLKDVPEEYVERCGMIPRHFDGFSSVFLYRRLYRCHTVLDGFGFDVGNVERKGVLSLQEFSDQYDGVKPVLLTGLADTWPARSSWTIDQLSAKYGDTAFRISQRSANKVSMKFKDYVSYVNHQRDEDPLYIFDEKFGESAPSLLNDYSVPHIFQEDYFDVLDEEQRPPYRWFIIGPQRSGASWHVDPALTSAWNTLLCGRKRWALYPPGKVPLGVTVHVNDEDGDVNIETPTSLQWWLDFYPLLAEEDRPIECTQLPGETIFVPSGWWHCVLNLETTVAVTQNFVNSKNFEYVCLDMAPGYHHKGVCRAGLLALDEDNVNDHELLALYTKDVTSYKDLKRNEKGARHKRPKGDTGCEATTNGFSHSGKFGLCDLEFSYDVNFLAMFLDKERDHYSSPWSSGNCIGPRDMRDWLYRLWVRKPVMRPLIWKGACLALNADKWLKCLEKVCSLHNLPLPTDDEKLPVGSGSNPVYLLGSYAIKIFVEGGPEAAMLGLGSELEFYDSLSKVNSPLKDHIPEVLASGILYTEGGTLEIVPWKGKELPVVICKCDLIPRKWMEGFPFGVWSKQQFEYGKAGMLDEELGSLSGGPSMWPYIMTKRCKGKICAQVRDKLSWEEALHLASFLGEHLRSLHLLPHPCRSSSNFSHTSQDEYQVTNSCLKDGPTRTDIPAEWELFVRSLSKKKKNVVKRLTNWGDPIPSALIQLVENYLLDDFTKLVVVYQNQDGKSGEILYKPCSWIHSDIMDDNLHMEPCQTGQSPDKTVAGISTSNGYQEDENFKLWRPSHILDFSNLSVGDRLYDLIPIYLDIFKGDASLLRHFLQSYRLPLGGNHTSSDDKFARLSYHAMCYCILHEENILGAIFSIWKELRTAKSWEEVELTVWGELNSYRGGSADDLLRQSQ